MYFLSIKHGVILGYVKKIQVARLLGRTPKKMEREKV